MGHFRRDPRVEKKADGTWVSEADWAVEAQIRLRLARTFPDHNILGEEDGLTAAGGGEPLPDAPTWIVDPIDGTNNFIAGIPVWATLVALQIRGRNVLGAVVAPALDEIYDAALGAGARMNGDAIHVDPLSDLDAATVITTGPKEFSEVGLASFYAKLTHRCWRSRGFGDFWGHMLVARGAAHVMADPVLSVWDLAALEPIVTEAGGRLTTIEGDEWSDQRSCLTTNGTLHDDVLALHASDKREVDPPNSR